MIPAARHLAFHGAIVLLFGLLLGSPYARAIKRDAAAQIVNSWRVAHLSLPIGATLMLAVAALLSNMAAPMPLLWFITVSLIVSSYAFCVATPLAAISGQRGLSSGNHGLGHLVYAGNMIGAVASVFAAIALLAACFVAL